MNIPEPLTQAFEILAQVLIYASAWFIGWTSVMGVSALWKKLKKEADKDKKRAEEIIVKRADKILELDKERSSLVDEVLKLKEETTDLKEQKALLKKELKAEEASKGEKEKDAPKSAPEPARKKPDSKVKKEAKKPAR